MAYVSQTVTGLAAIVGIGATIGDFNPVRTLIDSLLTAVQGMIGQGLVDVLQCQGNVHDAYSRQLAHPLE
ncbi:hypothetical protein [Luteibacter aegosomatissinici]|uniref:hypothetical protein n=1 Tax=Luteibacter aegosomatissinici TaxID=2911539 RepID=UPI001FF7801A|nr:hypothetical protein [Luteibacter aegosomatissinici]UPG92664.1 hypothetical protein L2Y97_12385 [Luteibacter aegosomatissinici]